MYFFSPEVATKKRLERWAISLEDTVTDPLGVQVRKGTRGGREGGREGGDPPFMSSALFKLITTLPRSTPTTITL